MMMITRENKESREMTFNLIVKQGMKIGNKTFSYIPVEMLFADPSYQRTDGINPEKVLSLAENFEPRKMDALKVSAREGLFAFAIIDGCHRLEAAKRNGIEYLECEILFGLSIEDEARLFAEQNDHVEKVTPAQKHKANVLLGVQECRDLESACRFYGIAMKKDLSKRGRQPIGVLQSYTDALRISKAFGLEGLEWIFGILQEAKYTSEYGGFSSYVLGGLFHIYDHHMADEKEMKNFLHTYLKQFTPRILKAKAVARYPMRDARIACALLIEDEAEKFYGLDKTMHERFKEQKKLLTRETTGDIIL